MTSNSWPIWFKCD